MVVGLGGAGGREIKNEFWVIGRAMWLLTRNSLFKNISAQIKGLEMQVKILSLSQPLTEENQTTQKHLVIRLDMLLLRIR